MKKRLFLIIAVLFCVLFLIATAAACADKGDTGENLSGDTGENPGGDTGENTGGDVIESPGGDTGENPGGDTGENPGGDTGENPGGDTGENPGIETFEFVFEANGDGTYAVTGYKGNIGQSITVPSTYNGSAVTGIVANAFRNCTGVTSVTIPDSVTSIGMGAFSGCSSLESITIPFVGAEAGKTSSDTYQYPFGYIFGISSYIDGGVYQHYYGESISITTADYYNIPSSLRSVTVTGGNILYGAFYGCSMLTSVTIPDSVTSMGERAFYNCRGLTLVTIGDSVTSIGSYAFSGCSGLTEINWNAVSIADFGYYSGVFSNAGTAGDGITVTFGESVQKVPAYAFRSCTGLTSVTIGDGVTSIGNDAFYNCDNLISVYYTGDIAGWCGISGLGNVMSGGRTLYIDGSKVEGVVTIPDGVTSIPSYAFRYQTGITSVTIPDSVTSIGDYAFYECYLTIVYNYSDLEITAGSGDYGYVAYYVEVVLTEENQDNVNVDENGYITYTDGEKVLLLGYLGSEKDIDIPEGVKKIAKYAFYNNADVISVTLPESLTEIGNQAFNNCYKLKEIYNNSTLGITAGSFGHGDVAYYAVKVHDSGESESIFNEDGFAIVDGVLYGYNGSETVITIPDTVTSIGKYAFRGNEQITSVSITDRVTSIGDYAFEDCSSLTSIDIPAEVTSIGGYAFFGCTDLIQIENGVDYVDKWVVGCDDSVRGVTLRSDTVGIGGKAFDMCMGLTSITIPDSVTSIGDHAFSGCTRLPSVTIPDSVTSIGSGAFYQCLGLTTVTIGNSVISIGSMAFYYCDGLKSVTIPDSVTSIGSNAFAYCSGLTSVTMGEGVTSIGGGVFSNCGLTSINIPYGVTSIGGHAFYNCSGLTSVTIPHNVTSIGDRAFDGCTDLTEINWNAVSVVDFNSDSNVFADAGTAGAGIAVTFGESVQKIPAYAFYKQFNYSVGCPNIKSVTIGSNVTSIGSSAFEDCASLTYVTIGDGVTSIGDDAFYNCSGLTSIYYTGDIAGWCGISGLYEVMSSGRTLYIDGRKVEGAITIPDGVTSIGEDAFRGCTGLTSVTIPDSVTSIGRYAFSGCTNLTSVVFEATEGWQVSDYSDFSRYTSLASTDLADASTAATYLKSTYRYYYWRMV